MCGAVLRSEISLEGDDRSNAGTLILTSLGIYSGSQCPGVEDDTQEWASEGQRAHLRADPKLLRSSVLAATASADSSPNDWRGQHLPSRARRQSWNHAGTHMTSILLSRLVALCPLEWFPWRSTWLLRRYACTVWLSLEFSKAFCFGRQGPVSHVSTSRACFVAGRIVLHPLDCAAAPASFSHKRIETLRGAPDATAICSISLLHARPISQRSPG
jgi:hypothetical protein